MNEATVKYYGAQADKKERDPFGPDGRGRAQVVNGRGFQKWRRFNPGAEVIWVSDDRGVPRALTRTQIEIMYELLKHADGKPITFRAIATRLKVSPSTVSRAAVKLASYGLIAYLTGRGRYAVTLILKRVPGDGLDRFKRVAQATVRRWSQYAERRISRLKVNVASYLHERGKGVEVDSLYYYLTTITKDATLTPWTAEDMAELDREMGL